MMKKTSKQSLQDVENHFLRTTTKNSLRSKINKAITCDESCIANGHGVGWLDYEKALEACYQHQIDKVLTVLNTHIKEVIGEDDSLGLGPDLWHRERHKFRNNLRAEQRQRNEQLLKGGLR